MLQLGKSNSHSCITETVPLQETSGMYRKADRQTHLYTHKHTHGFQGSFFLGRGAVACIASDLSRSLPHRRFCYQVWLQASAHIHVCVCVCVCVRPHLKSNDEHHPDRDLGKTELFVNWNCHIHSKCLK